MRFGISLELKLENLDQLRIIRFDRGVMVIAKDYKPFITLTDPVNPNGNKLTFNSLAFCKMHGRWVAVR